MKMRWLARWVYGRLVPTGRPPDFVVGEAQMRRWWMIPRNPIFNIYLHQFMRSDDDRALHDHMYVNLSLLLAGEYIEHTIAAGGVGHHMSYRAGALRARLPHTAHRIELPAGAEPCWSLFITGPRMREWGFHCPSGWRSWKVYTKPGAYGQIGKGCEG